MLLPRLFCRISRKLMPVPLIFLLLLSLFTIGQPPLVFAETLSTILEKNAKSIERPSRRKINTTIDTLFASNAEGVPNFLRLWRDKKYGGKRDGAFFWSK